MRSELSQATGVNKIDIKGFHPQPHITIQHKFVHTIHAMKNKSNGPLESYQTRVDEWIQTVGVRYFSELTNMAILTEEVGEVARFISRKYGDQSFKQDEQNKDLADELADVLWVIICLANQTGINLDEALERNFNKKNTRDATRHIHNPKLR